MHILTTVVSFGVLSQLLYMYTVRNVNAQVQIHQTLATLKTSGILAIIRAKNCDAAINRGLELIELGCRSIEVTLDTVLKSPCRLSVGRKCLVGTHFSLFLGWV